VAANGESLAPLLRIGLVVNPLAGIGGAVGLQGSDGEVVQRAARERDGKPRGEERLSIFLQALRTRLGGDFGRLAWCTWGGVMGAQILSSNGVIAQVAGEPAAQTSAQDTQLAVKTLGASHVDLMIFVGGDGTARDVLTVADEHTCVLGLPAGVKMHSGVFAISPSAAADVVAGLAQGSLVGRIPREVRDYVPAAKDATNAKHQAVATKRYGELWVPEAAGYLQQMKVGGKEDEGLVVQEIVSFFLDNPEIYSGKALVMGPGSTCLAIKQALGLNGALLGCDVLLPTGEAMENATSADLLNLASQHTLHVLVSFTRHQGFLLGRGNQQLSAEVLHTLRWKEDVTILGSRTKLATLDQRPMLVDTGDAMLDQQLSGLVSVLTGYDDFLLYRVSSTLLPDS
jgi:predicted polyphosphate/ATP-dependent NAD kinase